MNVVGLSWRLTAISGLRHGHVGKPRLDAALLGPRIARKLHLLVAITTVIAAPCGTPAHAERLAPRPIKLILVGDSTVAQGTGWGGAFCASHVVSLVTCVPIGRGGRSSESYRAEGSWQLAREELAVPGYAARYVMIAFGANDQSHDPAIGTTPDVFAANLTRFVTEVRAAGGEPILLTPLATRRFRDGKLVDAMTPSASRVREIAMRTGTSLIDLDELSGAFYQKMGAAAALRFEIRSPSAVETQAAALGTTLPPGNASRRNYQADYIHLNSQGAAAIATLIAPRLTTVVPALRTYVKP